MALQPNAPTIQIKNVEEEESEVKAEQPQMQSRSCRHVEEDVKAEPPPEDLCTWLSRHRLGKFAKYMAENEVILADLLHYTDEDME